MDFSGIYQDFLQFSFGGKLSVALGVAGVELETTNSAVVVSCERNRGEGFRAG